MVEFEISKDNNNNEQQSEVLRLAKQKEINSKLIEILSPNMSILKDIILYINECGTIMYQYFTTVGYIHRNTPDPLPSDTILNLFIQLIDILITLDLLKERKNGFFHDFYRYKQAHSNNIISMSKDVLNEMDIIQKFIPSSNNEYRVYNSIFSTVLKPNMKRVIGCDEFLMFIIEFILLQIDSTNYVLTDILYAYIRTMPYFFVLLDGPLEDIKNNVFLNKKLKLPAIQKLFKTYPIVPVYHDMTLQLVTVLELAPHFNKTTMYNLYAESAESKHFIAEYNLLSYWKTIREEHVKCIAQLQFLINKYQLSQEHISSIYSSPNQHNNTRGGVNNKVHESAVFLKLVEPKYIDYAQEIFDSVLLCMKLIHKWKFYLMQIFAYKLYKFTNSHAIGDKTTLTGPLLLLANAIITPENKRVINQEKIEIFQRDRESEMGVGIGGSTVGHNDDVGDAASDTTGTAEGGPSADNNGVRTRNRATTATAQSPLSRFATKKPYAPTNHQTIAAETLAQQNIAAAIAATEIEGYEYYQSIKNNFTSEELSIFIDIISCLKSLGSFLIHYDALLAPILRFCMHYSVEKLVIGDLLPLLHRVDKRNKTSDLQQLQVIRSIAADWVNGVDPGK